MINNEVLGKVGVIGLGSVGKAVKHALSFYHSCSGYDIIGEYDWKEILDTSIVLVCVSTPEGIDGRLDCSNVDDVLKRLLNDQYGGVVVIKSTLNPGFMDDAVQKYMSLRLVYMPEFLREKSNFTWFVYPDRIVISGEDEDINETMEYFNWLDEVPILKMSHIEAEIGKLAHNAFIALKVSFTNEVEGICNEHCANAENVMSVIWADRRVKSNEHLKPYMGAYGGKCVPKDTNALINSSSNTTLLKAAEEVNNKVKCDRKLYSFDSVASLKGEQ